MSLAWNSLISSFVMRSFIVYYVLMRHSLVFLIGRVKRIKRLGIDWWVIIDRMVSAIDRKIIGFRFQLDGDIIIVIIG
jgi:hypothetical protein